MNGENLNYNRLIFQELCKSGALIAIFLFNDSWGNFFFDIFDFMQRNQKSLIVGLAIIEEFCNELDQVYLEKRKLTRV